VVAGLGVDNQGYVLADYSLVGTPNEWGSAALKAYAFFEADHIIGEVNFGGEMVGTIIKSLAKEKEMGSVPFKAIRASRGKQVRAEPVSNLYQQNHIHHVGTHPDLEDQMCNWVPGEKSPDRLDACVWAVTELMLGKNRTGGFKVSVPDKDEQKYMATRQSEEENEIVFRHR
jgi:phage terminase large subunit-like protein